MELGLDDYTLGRSGDASQVRLLDCWATFTLLTQFRHAKLNWIHMRNKVV